MLDFVYTIILSLLNGNNLVQDNYYWILYAFLIGGGVYLLLGILNSAVDLWKKIKK